MSYTQVHNYPFISFQVKVILPSVFSSFYPDETVFSCAIRQVRKWLWHSSEVKYNIFTEDITDTALGLFFVSTLFEFYFS